jgi:hypothetical protein
MRQSRLTDEGIPERFLPSGHKSTKRFVDDYEYIRIYLLEDFFDSRWLVQNFLWGANCFLSVQANVCGG